VPLVMAVEIPQDRPNTLYRRVNNAGTDNALQAH